MDEYLKEVIEQNNLLPNVTTNFDALRTEGTAYIAQFGHKLWTDFNTHDPGITILEVLCFAINDLAFRTDFPIEDLLAAERPAKERKHFFSAAEILTCNPVTSLDFRKLIIDVDGVKNAWVFKGKESTTNGISLNGLYDIYLELDAGISSKNKNLVDEIKEAVNQKLCAYRNLGEDFLAIKIIGEKSVCLKGDIVVTPNADANEVHAQIIYKIESFLSFCPQFYSLEEMFDKEKTCNDIFQSAILENGFLDDEELEKSKLRRVIYKSDLYQEIMDVEGVQAITSLAINLCKDEDKKSNYHNEWCLDICQLEQYKADKKKSDTEGIAFKEYVVKISPKFKPVLDRDNTKFTLSRTGVILPTNAKDIEESILLLESLNQKPPIHSSLDNPIPKGTYRDLNHYASIQEDFPLVYRIGKDQLPKSFGPKRVALAKQLKGFLTFFDQILANYLAQLEDLKSTFSICPDGKENGLSSKSLKGLDLGLDNLFFDWHQITPKAIEQLQDKIEPEALEILKAFKHHPPTTKEKFKANLEATLAPNSTATIATIMSVSLLPNYTKEKLEEIIESPLEQQQRRHQVLDHLIARFGEKFTDYALSLYPVCADQACKSSTIKLKETHLDCKTDFLKHLPILGRNRGKGFNYKSDDCIKKELFWNSENVAGLKKRVNKLLCIKEAKRVQLSCEPRVEVIKDIDEQNKTFTWVVAEKGENPLPQIFLRSIKSYSLRSKSKKDQERIKEALIDAFPIGENLKIEPFKEEDKWYIALRFGNRILAQSTGFETKEEADNFLDTLEKALFPLNCETEGFHVLEHILLRPKEGNDIVPLKEIQIEEDCIIKDSYSFWISIIALESWNRCTKDNGSRHFFEQLVRREAPAHIGINFCWLTEKEMYHFELAYKNWLYDLARPYRDKCQIEESQNHLIEILNTIFSK